MFCSHCGKEIEEGSTFCPFCGEKIGINEEINLNKKRNIIFAIVTLVLVVIIVGLVLSMTVFKRKRPRRDRVKMESIKNKMKERMASKSNVEREELYSSEITIDGNVYDTTENLVVVSETTVPTTIYIPPTTTYIPPTTAYVAPTTVYIPPITQASNFSTNAPFSSYIPPENVTMQETTKTQTPSGNSNVYSSGSSSKSTEQLLYEAMLIEQQQQAQENANNKQNGPVAGSGYGVSSSGPGGSSGSSSGYSNAGPGGSSYNVENDGPRAVYGTVKGIKEGTAKEDDEWDGEDYYDDEDDDNYSSSSFTITTVDTFEDDMTDDDGNECIITYVTPGVKGGSSDERDIINGYLEDYMEEIIVDIEERVSEYTKYPKTVKFAKASITSQTKSTIKIQLKATITPRSGGSKTLTYTITYNRNDEDATISMP